MDNEHVFVEETEITASNDAGDVTLPNENEETPNVLIEDVENVESEKNVPEPNALEMVHSMATELSDYKEQFHEMVKKVEFHANEMNKLYHNEFSGRLQKMQEDIEKYRERDEDRIYDGILIELASLYSRDVKLIEIAGEEKLKKRLNFLFEDLLSLLRKYNVEKVESQPGDKRNARHCKVIEREQAKCSEEHDTIARSRSIGFHAGNRTLLKENVDVYVYKNTDENSSNN
jgi:hypothetical protein